MAAPRVSWEKYQLVLAERDQRDDTIKRLREALQEIVERSGERSIRELARGILDGPD